MGNQKNKLTLKKYNQTNYLLLNNMVFTQDIREVINQ